MSSSFDSFKSALSNVEEIPYCTGAVALDATTSTLFYQTGDLKAEMIDFAQPTEEQLARLAEACEPATFGLDQKDVLDESYRKAGKMDSNRFATHFSPLDLGIVNIIRDVLLQGKHSKTDIKVELYKLNVYGSGAFFKSHVDTPRSDKMFGSLVVILPTQHEGGSLLFRHRGQEYTFDSAKAVSSEPTPHAAFVAFFSDVEHEVATVTSGYRVTLTYNLFFTTSVGAGAVVVSEDTPDDQLKEALAALLEDKTFLPSGGLVGFGLAYKYPFSEGSTKLEDLRKCLKGTDAALLRICDSLSLECSLKAYYHDRYDESVACLVDSFAHFGEEQIEGGIIYYLHEEMSGRVVYASGGEKPDSFEEEEEILWAKPLGKTNEFRNSYVRYGNEATMSIAYGDVCIIADVLPADERS